MGLLALSLIILNNTRTQPPLQLQINMGNTCTSSNTVVTAMPTTVAFRLSDKSTAWWVYDFTTGAMEQQRYYQGNTYEVYEISSRSNSPVVVCVDNEERAMTDFEQAPFKQHMRQLGNHNMKDTLNYMQGVALEMKTEGATHMVKGL